MHYRYLWILGIFCAGCTVTTAPSSMTLESPPVTATKIPEDKKPLTAIQAVSVGMDLAEVQRLMGDSVLVGYAYHPDTGSYEGITVPAPYRQEQLFSNNTVQDVLFYFTHVQKEDNIVADDELMPVIFQGDMVVAKGWDAYFRYKMP